MRLFKKCPECGKHNSEGPVYECPDCKTKLNMPFKQCPKCNADCSRVQSSGSFTNRCLVCGENLSAEDWYIDYYVNGIRKRKKTGPNKSFAEDVKAKLKVQIREGKYFDIQNNNDIKFEEMIDDFLAYSKINKRSHARDVFMVKERLLPFFGGKLLKQITPSVIEQYKAQRMKDRKKNNKKIKNATINREIATLKCMINIAIKNRKAVSNPMNFVKMLKEESTKLRILDDDEKKVLLSVCTVPMKRIVTFALCTGMRRGEILDLEWKNVDLKRKIITLTNTKSGKDREIFINPFLESILKECYNNSDKKYVFCHEGKKKYKTINSMFQNIVKRSGLAHYSFHTLRHTAASDMLDLGVDIVTVKEILGHSDLKTTLRYAHSKPANKVAAIEKLCSRMDN